MLSLEVIPLPVTDIDRRSYASFADFADPDGNSWTLQERGYRAS